MFVSSTLFEGTLQGKLLDSEKRGGKKKKKISTNIWNNLDLCNKMILSNLFSLSLITLFRLVYFAPMLLSNALKVNLYVAYNRQALFSAQLHRR